MMPAEFRHRVGHAAYRWTDAIFAIVDRDTDTRTVADWGRVVGASIGVLRSICVMQNVRPKPSLTFGRVLRLVVRGEAHMVREALEVDDPRTLERIVQLSGLHGLDPRPGQPRIDAFLHAQRLILEPRCHDAIRLACQWRDTGRPHPDSENLHRML